MMFRKYISISKDWKERSTVYRYRLGSFESCHAHYVGDSMEALPSEVK